MCDVFVRSHILHDNNIKLNYARREESFAERAPIGRLGVGDLPYRVLYFTTYVILYS